MTECFELGCNLDNSGYPRLTLHGVRDRAHRHSYRFTHGDIPDGHVIHHLCENVKCINPNHLVPLTAGEHCRLHKPDAPMLGKRKSHCTRGHPRTSSNVNAHGACKVCTRMHIRNWYHKHDVRQRRQNDRINNACN